MSYDADNSKNDKEFKGLVDIDYFSNDNCSSLSASWVHRDPWDLLEPRRETLTGTNDTSAKDTSGDSSIAEVDEGVTLCMDDEEKTYCDTDTSDEILFPHQSHDQKHETIYTSSRDTILSLPSAVIPELKSDISLKCIIRSNKHEDGNININNHKMGQIIKTEKGKGAYTLKEERERIAQWREKRRVRMERG